jgi:hypothetical protein
MTDERQSKLSQKPRFLWRVPDISLATHGSCVVMETEAGLYRLDRPAGGVAEQHELNDGYYPNLYVTPKQD